VQCGQSNKQAVPSAFEISKSTASSFSMRRRASLSFAKEDKWFMYNLRLDLFAMSEIVFISSPMLERKFRTPGKFSVEAGCH
jgi:hypothetical protein